MGQKMACVGRGTRKSTHGYISQVSYYRAKRCEGCPMRGQCHKAQGNRMIEVNHRLNELKARARERLTSETGKYHRSKRPIEVEAVFGQMKSNNRFNRFSMRGMDKVDIEFALMCIGHNLRKWAKMKVKGLWLDPTGVLQLRYWLQYGHLRKKNKITAWLPKFSRLEKIRPLSHHIKYEGAFLDAFFL